MPYRLVPILVCACLLCAAAAWAASFEEVVKRPDPQARYLFYLHGSTMEHQGRNAVHKRYGTYEYDRIIEQFEARGLTVVEAVRGQVNPNEYASRIVMQVRRLMAAGVPAGHVTVSGFSKGGLITMLVASSLGDPGVRYVVMAGCGSGSGQPAFDRAYELFLKRKRGARLQGQLLSIYAGSDLFAGSCGQAAQQAGSGFLFREIRIKSDLGHGLFYKPLPQWINPVALFATGGR